MTLEKLKELLESGAITQEEFDEMAESIGGKVDPTPDPTPNPDPDPDDLEKKIRQSEIDRALAKERKEKAEYKRKLESMQKKYLSEEERRKEDFDRQKKEFEEQKRELALEKNKMYGVKSLQKAKIDKSDEAMALMEKLVATCEDETEVEEVINLMKAWRDKDVAKGVEEEVNKRFEEGGYTPKKSDSLNGGVNPWKAEQFNFTMQMNIEATNPELAKQLKTAAGVKE